MQRMPAGVLAMIPQSQQIVWPPPMPSDQFSSQGFMGSSKEGGTQVLTSKGLTMLNVWCETAAYSDCTSTLTMRSSTSTRLPGSVTADTQ